MTVAVSGVAAELGGNPDCSQCGCIASAALKAVARHELPLGLRVGTVFDSSFWVGARVRRLAGAASAQ